MVDYKDIRQTVDKTDIGDQNWNEPVVSNPVLLTLSIGLHSKMAGSISMQLVLDHEE
jgi:hypothetical protein